MLIDIGFLEHLHANFPEYQQLDPSGLETKMLPMLTGIRSEPEEIERLGQDLQQLMDSANDSALSHAIYTGLVEAMGNCAGHAYSDEHLFRCPTEKGRWRMSGPVTNGCELEVIFFDQGATIPVSLPRSGSRERAHRWVQRTLNPLSLEKAHDGQRTQAAMAAGRSAYRRQGRGHSLVKIGNLVNRAALGSLRFLSRKGRHIYLKDDGESIGTFDNSIGGTLVHWRFEL